MSFNSAAQCFNLLTIFYCLSWSMDTDNNKFDVDYLFIVLLFASLSGFDVKAKLISPPLI